MGVMGDDAKPIVERRQGGTETRERNSSRTKTYAYRNARARPHNITGDKRNVIVSPGPRPGPLSVRVRSRSGSVLRPGLAAARHIRANNSGGGGGGIARTGILL